MVKLPQLLFLVFLFICPSLIKGQTVIELLKQTDSIVLPGSNQTIIFKIANLSDSAIQLKLNADLETPLRTVLCPKTIKIDSGIERNVLVTFSIPKNAAPKVYKVAFSLFLDSQLLQQFVLLTKVLKVSNVVIRPVAMPDYARAGENIKVNYMITNLGNGEEILSLRSFYANIKTEKNIVLKPDSNIMVYLDKKTLEDMRMPIDQTFDLRLFNEKDELVKAIQKSVKVYPIKAVKNDPYHRIPLNISSSYLTRYTDGVQQANTYQIEISGQGSLDSAGKHKIDYLYRGPDQQNVARVGRFSQKYAGYIGPKLSVYAGERSYSTTMLTDMFRFGTGIEVGYKPTKNISLSSYYAKPKFQPDLASVSSFLAKFDKNEKWQFTTGLIKKDIVNGADIFLHSVGAFYNNQKSIKSSTELATSYGKIKKSFAGHFNVEFNVKNFRVASDAMYASPFFPGYFSNSATFNNNIGYGWKKMRFVVSWNYNDANPKLDTLFGIAPKSEVKTAGLGYNFPKKHFVMMQMVQRQKIDRFEPKLFNYEEQMARLSYIHTGLSWGYSFIGEMGYTQNFLLPDNQNKAESFTSQFNLSFNSNKSFGFSSYVHFLRNTRYSSLPTNYLLYGSNVNFRIKNNLTFVLQYQNTFLIDELYSDRNLFDARFNFKISERQTLSLFANYGLLFNSSQNRDFYGLASYSLRLDVPVKKIATYGSVEGTIIKNNADKVEGVLLFLGGQTAITNKEGKFLFNNIKPGPQVLLLEKGSIGVHDVADTIFPLHINVLPAQKVRVNFGLVKAVKIEGTVKLVEKVKVVRSKSSELSLPQLIVELSNGEQTILTTTNREGYFSYLGLKPGVWNVRIVPTSWTNDFVMQVSQQSINAKSNETVQADFIIEPKLRQIKFKNSNPVDIKK